MPTGKRNDPYAAFNFTVEIAGITLGFSEVSGINTENDKIEYREGADKARTVSKLPGLIKYGDITFKRGYTKDSAKQLWEWRQKVLSGKTERRDGSIVLNDEAGSPALRWAFTAAWPIKYSAPAFNGKTNEVAVQELVVTVESLAQEDAG